MYDKFEAQDTVVVAISQEDRDLENAAKFLKHFDGTPPFDVLVDVGREQTKQYRRVTTYLIDKQGTVREIFPMMIRHRASWDAVLAKVEELE